MAWILKILERPYHKDESNAPQDLDWYLNSLWLIIVTITTVGYGEIRPRTYLGRIVTVAAAIWGSILISVIVVSIVKLFDLEIKEKKAMRHITMARSAT